MEIKATGQDLRSARDEREWELADEELDRAGDTKGPSLCSTSRPCTCSRCHCR
jgi:hypothetical protein